MNENSRKRQGTPGQAVREAVRLLREEGQALAEYSLILAFIFAVCIIALGALGVALADGLDAVTAGFP